MASLDDKLRGNRKENYVGGESDSEREEGPSPYASPPVSDGLPQTGPKGVLTDYYRKMAEEKQAEMLAEKGRKDLIIQHSATVQSHSQEAAEAAAIMNVAKALDEGSLDQDPFMQQYRAKRMEELKKQASVGSKRTRFGNLVEVRGDKYDTLIDNCPAGIILIIHIYSELYIDCVHLNQCLTRLAKLYPTAKLCRVQSSNLGVSQSFKEKALPTLLVYRDGEVIGNHVRVTDTLGTNYTVEDLESFLQEKHCLPPESEKEDLDMMGSGLRGANKILGTTSGQNVDSDSD